VAFSRSSIRLARKTWRLPRPEKALALEALLWLTACRIAVRFSSYSRTSALVSWASGRAGRREASPDDCRIALLRAVRVCRATGCLARAMAAQAMLRRSGYAATLTFGVQRRSDTKIAAHAWIDCEGLIVSGAPEADQYVALLGAEPL
jgi:hypothetical protein